MVIAPGSQGELGILPSHAPLLTTLKPGMLTVRHDGEDVAMFVNGGFLEVMQDKVIVLADVAERAEEIDVAKAEEAKRNAEESLRKSASAVDIAAAEAALRRSLIQLKVAEHRRKKSNRA